jgi:hypothetical protein
MTVRISEKSKKLKEIGGNRPMPVGHQHAQQAATEKIGVNHWKKTSNWRSDPTLSMKDQNSSGTLDSFGSARTLPSPFPMPDHGCAKTALYRRIQSEKKGVQMYLNWVQGPRIK